MDAIIDKAAWSAACCRHQHCSCFTQQVHTYLRATLLKCRGYPNTLYAFDSHTELSMRDKQKPTLHQLNAIRVAKHYRNQIRYSWVTGCNRNLELFSGSCVLLHGLQGVQQATGRGYWSPLRPRKSGSTGPNSSGMLSLRGAHAEIVRTIANRGGLESLQWMHHGMRGTHGTAGRCW